MKARIKFSKTGSMRFIGHLDVLRYFQKAFRRAHISLCYSQGYSPHQLMSFTSPLGIGLSSDGEYLDLELEESIQPDQMVERLNEVMNEEIQVKGFWLLPDDSKPSMAMLAACDYLIAGKAEYTVPFSTESERRKLLDDFLEQKEIVVMKKTKRSQKEVDIRPNIYYGAATCQEFEAMTGQNYGAVSLSSEEYLPLIYFQLTAGSVVNIKPELVLEALCSFSGVEYQPAAYQIHRLEMYGDANGKKGEVHLLHDKNPCQLIPLSEY